MPAEESDLALAGTELIRKQLGDNLEIEIHEAGEFFLDRRSGRGSGSSFLAARPPARPPAGRAVARLPTKFSPESCKDCFTKLRNYGRFGIK